MFGKVKVGLAVVAILATAATGVNAAYVDGFEGYDAGSVIQGDGTLVSAKPYVAYYDTWIDITGGTIAPGTNGTAGQLTISSRVRFHDGATDGTLDIDIGGTTAGSTYDQLIVNNVRGDVWLGGTLDVGYIGAYAPTHGDTYDVLVWTGTRTGTFTSYKGLDAGNNFVLTPSYDDTAKKLTLTAHQVTHETAIDGVISGDANDNVLRSDDTAAILSAGDGADVLSGNGGDDILIGGGGADIMLGGAGSDVFTYTSITDSTSGAMDQILDFDAKDNSEDIFLQGLLNGTFTYVGTGSFNGVGDTEASFNDTTKILSIDIDGDATADMQIQLNGVASADLDVDDFTVT